MITRTLYIGKKAYVSTRHSQLLVRIDDDEQSMPIEDLGIVEFDSPQITVSAACLHALAEANVAVIVCGNNHLPSGLCLPLSGHSTHTERLRPQITASQPLRKRIWRDIIRRKILNQAAVLEAAGVSGVKLRRIADAVQSGDTTNREATAAVGYWGKVFGGSPLVEQPFERSPDGNFPNNMLNYLYAIIRAMTARGLVSTGLHPSIGIFHHNRYNPFCLADDLMEPFRPFADMLALTLMNTMNEPTFDLTPQLKRRLLVVPTIDCRYAGGTLPLMNAIQRTCTSLWQTLAGEIPSIILPELCPTDLLATDAAP